MNEQLIQDLIKSELDHVDNQWPDYHSHHEAYAVTKEEVEELDFELTIMNQDLRNYWESVKEGTASKDICLRGIKYRAERAIKEAVQVYVTALRAERLINSPNN